MAGGIAGSCSMIIVYPLDFARTRLGADTGKGHGAKHAPPTPPPVAGDAAKATGDAAKAATESA